MAKRIMFDPSSITDDTPVMIKKGDGVVATEGSGTNTVAQGDSTVPIYIGGKYAGYTVKNINPERGIEVVIDDSGATRWLPYNVNERLVPYITVSENTNGFGLNLLGAVAAGITDPIDYANWNVDEQSLKDAEALAPYYKDGKIDTKAAYEAGVGADIIKGYVSEFTAPSNAPTDNMPAYSDKIAPYVSSDTGSLDPFAAIAAGVTDIGDYGGFNITQDDLDEMTKLLKYRDPDTKEFRLDDAIQDGWTVDQLGNYFDMSNYVPPSERPVDPVYTKAQDLGVLKGSNLDVSAALDKGMTVAELKTLGVPEESIVQAQSSVANNDKYSPYITQSKGGAYLDIDKAVSDLNKGVLTKDDMQALGVSDDTIRLSNLRSSYKTADGGFDILRAVKANVPDADLLAIGYSDDDVLTAKDNVYMQKKGIDPSNFTVIDAIEKGIPEAMILRATTATQADIDAAKNYSKVAKFYDKDGRATLSGAIAQKATNEELKLLGFSDDEIRKGRAYDSATKAMDAGGYWLDAAKTQPNYDKMYEDGKLNLLTELYDNVTAANVNQLVSDYKNSTKVGDSYIPNSVIQEYLQGWTDMGLNAKQKSELLETLGNGNGAAYSNLLREYSAADWAKNFSSDPNAQQALVNFVKDDYGNVDPKKISNFLDQYNKAQITGWIKRHVTDKERKNAYLQMVRAGDYDGFDRAYREDNKSDVLGTIPAEYQEVVSKWLDTATDAEIDQFVNDWNYAQVKLEARKILDARKEMAANMNIGALWNDIYKSEVTERTGENYDSSVSLRPDFASNAQLVDYTPGVNIEVTSESKPWREAIKLGPSETNTLRNWIVEQVDTTIKDAHDVKSLDKFVDWAVGEVGKAKAGELTQQDVFHDISVLGQTANSYLNPIMTTTRLAKSIADKVEFDPSIAENADKIANYAYALANAIAVLEDVEQSRTDDLDPVAGTINKIIDEYLFFDLLDMGMIGAQLVGHGADYVSGYVRKDDDQQIDSQAAIADLIAGFITYPMSLPNTFVTDTPQGIAELIALILPGPLDIGKSGIKAAAPSIKRATFTKMFDIKNIVTGAKINLDKVGSNVKWIDPDPTGAKSVVLPTVEGKITEVTTPGFVADTFGQVVNAGTLKTIDGKEVGYTKYSDPNAGVTYLLNAEDGSKNWDTPSNQLVWTTLQQGVEENIKTTPFGAEKHTPVTVVYGNYRLTDDGNGITATVIDGDRALNYMTTDRYSSYKEGGLKPINVTEEGVKSAMFNKSDKPSGIMMQVFDAEDAIVGEDGHLRPNTNKVKEYTSPSMSIRKATDWNVVGKEVARTAKEIGGVLIDPRFTKDVARRIKDALGDNVHAKAQLKYALTHMRPEDAKKVIEWAERADLKALLEAGEFYKFNKLVGLDKVKISPARVYEETQSEMTVIPGHKPTDAEVEEAIQRVGVLGLRDAREVALDDNIESHATNLLAERIVELIQEHPGWKAENRMLQDPTETLYSIYQKANKELKDTIHAEFPELLGDEDIVREKLVTTIVTENPVNEESKKITKKLMNKISKIEPKQVESLKTRAMLAILEATPGAAKEVGKALAPIALAARMAMPAAAIADASITNTPAIVQTIDGESIATDTAPTETRTETITETKYETRQADINPSLADKDQMPSTKSPSTEPSQKVIRSTKGVSSEDVTKDSTVTQDPRSDVSVKDTKIVSENVTETKTAPEPANKTELTRTSTKLGTSSAQDVKTTTDTKLSKYDSVTDVKTETKITKTDETTKVRPVDVKQQSEVETPMHIINQQDTLQNVIQNQIEQAQVLKMDDIDKITKKLTETNIKIREPEAEKLKIKIPNPNAGLKFGDGLGKDDGKVLIAWRQGTLTNKGRKRPVWIVIRKTGGKLTRTYENKAPVGAKVINGKPHQTLFSTKKKLKPFTVKVGFNKVTVDLSKTGKDRLEYKRIKKEVSKYKLPTQKQLSGPRFKFKFR